MAQADSRVLVLGALAGVAGVSLGVMFYQGLSSRRKGSLVGHYFNRTNEQGPGIMLVDGPGLPGGQAEVLDRLEALIQSVSELKNEMKALKNALPTLQDQVREELSGRDEARRASPLHRTTPTRRKRAAGTITGTRAEGRSSEEAESEGGYMTALTDSEEDEQSDAEQRDEEQPAEKLSVRLERIDCLHLGTDSDKRESLKILLELREEFGQNSKLLWRLIRAYFDVHDISSTVEEKKIHAQNGKTVGEEAVKLNPTCAESHQWYAIICGVITEYDTVQNRIKNGYIFKDHLDKAIELKPQDPLSYYLRGRWCYTVAQLSWIERKVAATLFGEPPSATVDDALKNFLKVEELHPGYSKPNFVFLAKCYRDMGQTEKARKMCEAASSMDSVSKEDEEAQKELDFLSLALGV
ncbi:putative regulator of microtubule dynamics protein 2 [Scophthalmus maximus]|uniref:Regulator of microtubule dynamics protein 2 n=1 Tax=Scophthalmus maximus TaxID=52904 RepID=A0A2U9CCS0_SCOMX|nr:regulator of microtubule dynamics protein 2 [Scophthalmus maximus]XP_035462202.1 regulator of microtubule dynamics protein 2 [Scophthalmus maximus]XP_035462203.1 regulator of microtubule dynamics protein 2 [Scophthalmus maximus]AWP14365.1 putative regulator of microtubule dynamics protein 2 [Scophthalmus maximus]